MNTMLLLFAMTILVLSTKAQDQPVENSTTPTFESLMLKSRSQRSTGFVLIGIGSAALAAGTILAAKELENIFEESKNEGLIIALYAIGAASLFGSIPFFVSAKKNKRLALSMSFENIPRAPGLYNMALQQSIPSISFKLKL
ncbi:MAG: hypothetical protein V4725_08005 [Bacteroidota bacterium]